MGDVLVRAVPSLSFQNSPKKREKTGEWAHYQSSVNHPQTQTQTQTQSPKDSPKSPVSPSFDLRRDSSSRGSFDNGGTSYVQSTTKSSPRTPRMVPEDVFLSFPTTLSPASKPVISQIEIDENSTHYHRFQCVECDLVVHSPNPGSSKLSVLAEIDALLGNGTNLPRGRSRSEPQVFLGPGACDEFRQLSIAEQDALMSKRVSWAQDLAVRYTYPPAPESPNLSPAVSVSSFHELARDERAVALARRERRRRKYVANDDEDDEDYDFRSKTSRKKIPASGTLVASSMVTNAAFSVASNTNSAAATEDLSASSSSSSSSPASDTPTRNGLREAERLRIAVYEDGKSEMEEAPRRRMSMLEKWKQLQASAAASSSLYSIPSTFSFGSADSLSPSSVPSPSLTYPDADAEQKAASMAFARRILVMATVAATFPVVFNKAQVRRVFGGRLWSVLERIVGEASARGLRTRIRTHVRNVYRYAIGTVGRAVARVVGL
eukprot:ANDGO_04187.mRNA.1 hypothetical protein